MSNDVGRALTGPALVSVQAASRLAPSGFDPSRITIPVEVYRFLMGEGPLEGVWFGELFDGLPGAFWWRGILRCAAGWPEPPHA